MLLKPFSVSNAKHIRGDQCACKYMFTKFTLVCMSACKYTFCTLQMQKLMQLWLQNNTCSSMISHTVHIKHIYVFVSPVRKLYKYILGYIYMYMHIRPAPSTFNNIDIQTVVWHLVQVIMLRMGVSALTNLFESSSFGFNIDFFSLHLCIVVYFLSPG